LSREPAIAAAFDAARRLGIDEIEVALVESESTRVSVAGGTLEALEERRDRGLGVRVWADHRPGFSFTSDPSAGAVARAVAAAREFASFTAPDDANRAPGPAAAAPEDLRNADPALAVVPVARKIAIAHAVEAAARGYAPEVDRIRKAAYRDARRRVRIANSRGLDVEHSVSRAWLSIEAAARRGADQRTGSDSGWALGAQGLDPERVGRTGAARAHSMLGARPGRTARLPVVLEPEVTAALLAALVPAFSALRVLRRRTVLEGRLGQAIGAPIVGLVDDATLEGTWGSTPLDGEGQPTGRCHLVRAGVLAAYLHDGFTARCMGVPPTAHAQRGGYGAPPSIGAHNVHLLPTGETRGEVLAGAAGGLLVGELLGLHTVNTTTGDFSLGASGYEIGAGGAIGAPVDRLALSGSIDSLLRSFAAVADDVDFGMGAAGGSTVLLADMPVSGA
jgi:PmbA protein